MVAIFLALSSMTDKRVHCQVGGEPRTPTRTLSTHPHPPSHTHPATPIQIHFGNGRRVAWHTASFCNFQYNSENLVSQSDSQNSNPSAIWLAGMVLDLATRCCKNLEKRILHQHKVITQVTVHTYMTTLMSCTLKHNVLCEKVHVLSCTTPVATAHGQQSNS